MRPVNHSGYAWTAAQWLVFSVVLLAGGYQENAHRPAWISLLGGGIMTVSLVPALLGFLHLGANLSPWPQPRAANRLVTHGIYRIIRHPLYLSLIIFAVGWAVWRQSGAALAATALLWFVLHRKAAREEVLLGQRHPSYEGYRLGTAAFLPRRWIFPAWFVLAFAVWALLARDLLDLPFLAAHWFYPAIMVLGGFVAGITPEGGGAVAFPVLSIFFEVDRAAARDFSLMIQSIGMTSASIYILSRPDLDPRRFRPLLWFVPVACSGFVAGMLFLQGIPVFLLQALFLSLITTFTIAYLFSNHRGDTETLATGDGYLSLVGVLFAGGLCASLFGTGADILLYTLLVTRFRLREKSATQMSIMLMAAVSVFGFLYRGALETSLTTGQFQSWLAAFPVVLLMAPLGARLLRNIHLEWLLRGLVLLNVGQLVYFNLKNPGWDKLVASTVFSVILMGVFAYCLDRLAAGPKAAVRRD